MPEPVVPKPPQSVDLRNVMRYFASHVTVVTGALDTGDLFGLTVSAFTSVSLEPPLVLVCIRNESNATDFLSKAKRFCVNILSEDQRPIAEKFSLTGESGRFIDLDYYVGKGGSPVIRDSLGFIDCKITRELHEGDHTIFIGEAIDVSGDDKRPLLYLNRKYVKLENL
ncbi:MAG: flavin reductase family protein [Nitrososphaerota archaeon]|nr:flavin reductase family protein [Nitrososphaerota archaeon]